MKRLAHQSRAKQANRAARKHRINTIVKATTSRPRLIVNRTNLYIYAQIIDRDGNVVVSTNDHTMKAGTKSERAYEVGQAIAKAAQESKIKEVVFDRNGYLFHGRVKQVAEWARAGGLNF
jgi:large subunit ribosomal protein L18